MDNKIWGYIGIGVYGSLVIANAVLQGSYAARGGYKIICGLYKKYKKSDKSQKQNKLENLTLKNK
ncbi:MAG TPA: hypothetical protein ENG87_01115 [Candidatus Pacearchaeota archaeon]|nr:hypothetical protein BMS3Abin17_01088 [archaeon BMS3Abin17]HDK41950.1 hypothetical protein [Candidatus Pacearchaeota archaeon]HDZ60132.1 hypothetical protein [Candidatus Pacearchaeota archaeon]